MPALTGPLLPAGAPQLWVGGLVGRRARGRRPDADAWNGWGDDVAGFAASVARLRELADGRDVSPTWGGIALVGEDEADLERLLAARSAEGLSTDGVWTGTGAELRRSRTGSRTRERPGSSCCRWDRRTGST